jgi:uncharacterized protein (DUF433 family)
MKEVLNRITIIDGICNGKPTIRGMRITVQTVLEYILAGDSDKEILESYPFLEKEDLEAVKMFTY